MPFASSACTEAGRQAYRDESKALRRAFSAFDINGANVQHEHGVLGHGQPLEDKVLLLPHGASEKTSHVRRHPPVAEVCNAGAAC